MRGQWCELCLIMGKILMCHEGSKKKTRFCFLFFFFKFPATTLNRPSYQNGNKKFKKKMQLIFMINPNKRQRVLCQIYKLTFY